MKKGIESIGKFVISGRDTTKLFESTEETLDQMTSLVAMPIDRTFVLPIAPGRDVGRRPGCLDGFDPLIAVVAFIGSDSGGLEGLRPSNDL